MVVDNGVDLKFHVLLVGVRDLMPWLLPFGFEDPNLWAGHAGALDLRL